MLVSFYYIAGLCGNKVTILILIMTTEYPRPHTPKLHIVLKSRNVNSRMVGFWMLNWYQWYSDLKLYSAAFSPH